MDEMRLVKSTKSKVADIEISETMQRISGVLVGYLDAVESLQICVENELVAEFGDDGPIDLSSTAKLARITSKYAQDETHDDLRKFPYVLQGCLESFQRRKKKLMELSKSQRKMYSIVPARLAFAFFHNGDILKALVCILDYIDLCPDDLMTKQIAIIWIVHEGEYELADKKLAEWNLKEDYPEFAEISSLYNEYCHKRTTRAETFRKMNDLFAKIKETVEVRKSYSVYNLMTYTSWIFSTLANVPTSDDVELPDRSSHLLNALNKAESLIRHKLPGLIPYMFDNRANVNIKQNLEGENGSVTASDYIYLGFSIAWIFELRRELATLNLRMAQSRDAISAFILNWRMSLRSGSMFRVLQAVNGIHYCWNVLNEYDSNENLKITKTTSINLLARNKILVRCSTPIEKEEILSCRTPNLARSRHNSAADNVKLMSELNEKLLNLEVDEPNKVHEISKTCGCFICEVYPTNFAMAAEYCMAACLCDNFSQESMEFFDKEFPKIRERSMTDKCTMFNTKSIRPRPPILLNENIGYCAIRWLNAKIQSEEKTDAIVMEMIQRTLKILRYNSLRTCDLLLTFSQLARQYEFPQKQELSWMKPIIKQPFVHAGISRAKDIIKAVSPFGRRKNAEKQVKMSEESEQMLQKVILEMRQDMLKYTHLLTREWRANLFPYIGRSSISTWEKGYAWIESTSLGSRNAVQNKLGKCKRDSVSMRNAEKFKTCVEAIPDDITFVHILIGDDRNVYLIKLHSDRVPIVMPIANNAHMKEIMKKFSDLLMEDEAIAKNSGDRTPEQFWNARYDIDERVKTVVQTFETNFLGVASYLLLPSAKIGMEARKIARKMEVLTKCAINGGEAKELVYLARHMRENDWQKLVERFCEIRNVDTKAKEIIKSTHNFCVEALSKDNIKFNDRSYTYLAICPEMSQFCWECLPIFDKHPYVCRMVSVHAMFTQLESLRAQTKPIPLPIDVQKAYYVLDPENNLGETKKRMMDYITKFQWEGITGKAPEPQEVTDALESKDAFFYFGHGSGSKFFNRHVIKQSKCNAISLLMGCGSVKTIPQGVGFDGKSVLLEYAIARCPLVVGCLWTVTDGEIDRYLMRMIDDCFDRKKSRESGDRMRLLTEAMREARSKAKLKYLTGAAVVHYGWPVVAAEVKPKPLEDVSKNAMQQLLQMENTMVFDDCVDDAPVAKISVFKTPPREKQVCKTPPRVKQVCKTPPRTKKVYKTLKTDECEIEEEGEAPSTRMTRSQAARQSTRGKSPSRSLLK